MQVFLSEYLTSGFQSDLGGDIAVLAVEGAAMLRALAEDAAAIPQCHVDVIWNRALPPFEVANVRVHLVSSAQEEEFLFRRLARDADATIVIAPEFDRILETRCRMVAEAGGNFIGPTVEAVILCSDKLALAHHLEAAGVPTIPTQECTLIALADRWTEKHAGPVVVKPRFGAGSVDTFLVRTHQDIVSAAHAYNTTASSTHPIVQPFVSGEALSIAAIVEDSRIELLPICRQRIEISRQMHYAGGQVPATTCCHEQVRETARRAIAAVPGLRGYIGVDVILPDAPSKQRYPLIVEINPRLTSSYHGYRRLSQVNLAERLIFHSNATQPISWDNKTVKFLPDGTTKVCDG